MDFSFVGKDMLLRHDAPIDEVLFDALRYIDKDLLNCFCSTIVADIFDLSKIQTHVRPELMARSFCFIAMSKRDKEKYWECLMFAAYAEEWSFQGLDLPYIGQNCREGALNKYREMLYNFLEQEMKCPLEQRSVIIEV